MKKIISILAVITLGMSATSCADFLDVKPEGNPNQTNYFNTDKEAMDAIGSVYWIFDKEETWGRDLFWEQGCGDDMVGVSFRYPSLYLFQYTGNEGCLVDNWDLMTEYISRANWIISSLKEKGKAKGGVNKLTAIEQRTLGEALFMRAFLHFHIAYRYGRADQGVPFIRYEDYPNYTTELLETIPAQQETVMKNYELIEKDLDEAAGLLPLFETYKADDQGRAHKVAAWALKVKVYAYWAYHDSSKWSLIPALVDTIENDGGRDLLSSFADVFKIKNNYSEEYIWSVTCTGRREGGSRFAGVVLSVQGWGLYNGWGSLKPTRSLYEEYVDGDLRRDISVYSYGMPNFQYFGAPMYFLDPDPRIVSGFMFGKYMEPYSYGERKTTPDGEVDIAATQSSNPYISLNGNDMTTDLNIPLIRHAEMVLFKAEALIQQGKGGDAATQLNRLTSRAGLGNKYTTATMEDLKHERRCELAGEFTDRFMDLKRWKDYSKLELTEYDRVPLDKMMPLGAPIELKDKDGKVIYSGPNILCEGSGVPGYDKKVIWPVSDNGRKFEPEYDIVFPYPTTEVTKANGKLKQNPIGR